MVSRRGTSPARRHVVGCLLTASALAVGFAARADAPPAATLTVRLALRNDSGQVGCLLFASEKGYPKDPTAALQSKWCPIVSSASVCSFNPVPAGIYALACFHDENKNGRLDTGLFGIPSEGTVASNGAKGFMGPPKFKDAMFSIAGPSTEVRLRMSY